LLSSWSLSSSSWSLSSSWSFCHPPGRPCRPTGKTEDQISDKIADANIFLCQLGLGIGIRDPDPGSVFSQRPGSESGSAFNVCGSETLLIIVVPTSPLLLHGTVTHLYTSAEIHYLRGEQRYYKQKIVCTGRKFP